MPKEHLYICSLSLRRAFFAVELREDVEKALALQFPFVLFLFIKIVL